MKIKVKTNFVHSYNLPEYETCNSAGMDLRANITEEIYLPVGQSKLIDTGISVELPVGYEMQIRPRSGLAFKYGITVLNAPGTIDADFRGSIGIILYNAGNQTYKISPGDRIAQAVLAQYSNIEWESVDDLSNTDRGTGGFGSTGNK